MKLMSKYVVNGVTFARIINNENTLDYTAELKGDYTNATESELVKLVKDNLFKVHFAEYAMPEAIQKVDAFEEQLSELKSNEAEVKEVIQAVKEDMAQLKTIFVRATDLSPEDEEAIIAQFDVYEVGKSYKTNDVFNYNGTLYRVLQGHTSQADWVPGNAPSLYTVYLTPKTPEGEEVVNDFVQPTGAHDAYKIGDKVVFEGKVWESVIDNNTYTPSAYPQGWKLVDE